MSDAFEGCQQGAVVDGRHLGGCAAIEASKTRVACARSIPMKTLLYLCILSTLIDVFLLVYAWTLPLFPQQWRDKVNSEPGSLSPRVNNDSITGMLIILVTAVTCSLWAVLFYIHVLVPGLFIPW